MAMLPTTRYKDIFGYREALLKGLERLPRSLRCRTLLPTFFLFSQIQNFPQADLIITKKKIIVKRLEHPLSS
jgi:hypothetical protein